MTSERILMNDKSTAQLTQEIIELRQRVVELENSIKECEQAKAEREQRLRLEREERLLTETLRDVTLALTAQTVHPVVLDEILLQVQRIVPYKTANIALLHNNHLEIVRWHGYEQIYAGKPIPNQIQPLADFPLDRQAIQSQLPLVIADTHQEPDWVISAETGWIKSHLAVPLCARDSVLGLLRLDSDTARQFSGRDAEQLQPLANAAAIALENAHLFEQVQQELDERKQTEAALQNSIRQMEIAYKQAIIYARELKEEVAKHRQTKEAIEQLRRQHELILNTAGEGIFGLDLAGKHTFVNPAAARMLGYEISELVGRPGHSIWHHTHSDGSPYSEEACPIYAAYQHGTVYQGDDEIFWRKDGASFPVEYVSTPILEKGEIVGAVVVFKDITHRRHLEEQYRQAQKMEAVGRLAGGIAHDFNNILTVITGHVEFMQEHLPVPDDPLHESVKEIKQASDRATTLTRQLLTFSRRQPIQVEILNVNQVITDIQNMLARLIGEDIKLVTELEPTVGWVEMDPNQLNQILMNLAVNARDAMPQGGSLTITTSNVELADADKDQHPELEAGRYVSLTISDTGAGMDAETQTQIFEPFYSTKPIGKGTGLGLSVVYAIVQKSNGDISVTSAPGAGATFQIYLPRSEKATPPIQEVKAGQAAPAPPSGSANILLVEDETSVRLVTRKFLQKHGFTVLTAAGADEAVALCHKYEGKLDLLLADVVMPQISGYELAKKLKEIRPDMKVLFISGYSDEELGLYGDNHARADLLQKPFSAEALIEQVYKILSG